MATKPWRRPARMLFALATLACVTMSTLVIRIDQASASQTATLYIKKFTWTNHAVLGHGTFTITGSGFGTEPSVAVSNPCGDTGDDFSGMNLAIQDETQGWIAGSDANGSPSCVGLRIMSYSNTSIKVSFGSQFKSVQARSGDIIAFYIQNQVPCAAHWESKTYCAYPGG
jgi:hypothetical protein